MLDCIGGTEPLLYKTNTVANFMQYLMNNYGDRAHTLVKGEGCYLYNQDGQRYLDALSGIAVCGLGHSHPDISAAISKQASTLLHISNLYNIEGQQKLARNLCSVSGMNAAYFCNSGAEANETAIKIARKYAHQRGITTPKIIVANGSFHGRTLATLSATGNPKVHAGFGPLVEGFVRVPYNDVAAVKEAAAQHNDIVAILVEPIQGEGGVITPDDNYLNQLREICDTQQWLLMLDEIQTGNGRTGKYFAFEHNGIKPDVLCTAKGLGNGVPIGACLAAGVAAELLQPGNHGSTYGGNPLVCSAALVVNDILMNTDTIANADSRGQQIRDGLALRLKGCSLVKEIRGKGLMIGIELNTDCGELVEKAWQQKLLINVTAANTVRLLPPLIIDSAQADEIIDTVATLILTKAQA